MPPGVSCCKTGDKFSGLKRIDKIKCQLNKNQESRIEREREKKREQHTYIGHKLITR